MNTAETILVIITSSLLALFLLLAIVLVVIVLKLVKSLRRIMAKAETVIDSAEAVTDAFKNVKGPLAALKLIQNIVSLVGDHKRERK